MAEQYKLYVDFRLLGPALNVDTLMLILKKRSGRGSRNVNTTTYIVNAYKKYDPNISQDMLRLMSVDIKTKYLIEKYEISCRDDFYYIFRHMDAPEEEAFIEPPKRILNFDPKSKEAIKCYNFLLDLRFKDRGEVVYKILEQYLLLGNDEIYMDITAKRMMNELRLQYEAGDKGVEEKIDFFMRYIKEEPPVIQEQEIELTEEERLEELKEVFVVVEEE